LLLSSLNRLLSATYSGISRRRILTSSCTYGQPSFAGRFLYRQIRGAPHRV